MALSRIVGQERAIAILRAGLRTGRLPSYLFVGPPGVGKRTCALAFAQALICRQGDTTHADCPTCRQVETLTHPDLKVYFPQKTFGDDREAEDADYCALLPRFALGKTSPAIPPEAQLRIRRIREIIRELGFAPGQGRRVVVLLSADQMNVEAANAFLKTLEEPQAATVFVLTTHRPLALLPTIRSRCQTVKFPRLPKETMVRYLAAQSDRPQTQLELAAEAADGSLRAALECLTEPESYFSRPALEVFSSPGSDTETIARIEGMERGDSFPFVFSLLALYRQALHHKLGLETKLPFLVDAVSAKARALSTEELTSNIERLLTAIGRTRLYLNRRLFLYSLISSLS